MTLTLIFNLGEELYGLEIDAIQEIVENPPRHYVPLARGVLAGAINFHGQVLAEIDLPALLGFPAGRPDHRRVVLTQQFKSLALMVDKVQRIVKLDLSALQPPPTSCDGSAIRGVADLEETIVNMLDIDGVINQLEHIYAE